MINDIIHGISWSKMAFLSGLYSIVNWFLAAAGWSVENITTIGAFMGVVVMGLSAYKVIIDIKLLNMKVKDRESETLQDIEQLRCEPDTRDMKSPRAKRYSQILEKAKKTPSQNQKT